MPPEVLERLAAAPCRPQALWSRELHLSGIEDFLFIGGDRMPVRVAAERLGVSKRTIERYRAELRRVDGLLRGSGP